MAGQQRRGIVRRLLTRKPGAAPGEAGRSPALEVLIATVLGVAAVLTAYAAYKTDLADGDTLKAFQEGSAIYDDANQQYLEGNQQLAEDTSTFTQYAIARERGERKVAAYIKRGLMDGTLPEATDEWEQSKGELPSPLEAESYEVKPLDRAEELVAQGDALFEAADAKDKEGDSYTLATVILAVSLFFGGIAGVTRSHLISVVMTGFASALVIGAGVYIFTI